MSKVAVATIGFAMFCTLEVGARLLTGQPVFSLENLAARQTALLKVHSSAIFDPLLGWITAPGIQKGIVHERVTIGDHGIRMNSEQIRPSPQGSIVAVGDSFTFGSEVADDETWPAQLERSLGTPVVNGAGGGWGSDQIILRTMDLVPKLRPKAVIVSFLDDDILRAGYRVFGGANKPYFEIVNGELALRNSPVPPYDAARDIGRLRDLLGYSEIANIVGQALAGHGWLHGRQYIAAGNDPVEVSCLLLRRVAKHAADNGYRLLFVMQYAGGSVSTAPTRPSHAVRVLACAHIVGIETLDLWQPLRDAPSIEALYIMRGPAFRHMSVEGNAFVAANLLRLLTNEKSTTPTRDGH